MPSEAEVVTGAQPSRLPNFASETLVLQSLCYLSALIIMLLVTLPGNAQQISREQWGGMPVSVSHQASTWVIAGKKNRVIVDGRDLSLKIATSAAEWTTAGSTPRDMLVKNGV